MSEPRDDQPGDRPGGHADDQRSKQPSPGPQHPQQVTLRRAPRYRAFVITGGVIGVLAALVLAVVFPGGAGGFSARAIFGYVGAAFALIGAVVGGLVAVLVERPRRR